MLGGAKMLTRFIFKVNHSRFRSVSVEVAGSEEDAMEIAVGYLNARAKKCGVHPPKVWSVDLMKSVALPFAKPVKKG